MWENGEHEHSCTSISNPVTSLGLEMHIKQHIETELFSVSSRTISMCDFYLPQAKTFRAHWQENYNHLIQTFNVKNKEEKIIYTFEKRKN